MKIRRCLHQLFSLLTLSAMSVLSAGCDLHTSDNGDLDGFWQLTQMDTLATNRSGDMLESRIYWSVQGNMLEMRDLHNLHGVDCYLTLNFRFRHEQGKLYLSEPIANIRDISDSVVTSPATVKFYGLSRLDEEFDVLQLDGAQMRLQSAYYRFHFRRY